MPGVWHVSSVSVRVPVLAMSDASAYVQMPDGEMIGHANYQGSVSILHPNLSADCEQAWKIDKGAAQRDDGRNEWDVLATCDHQLEMGYAYTSYGGGFYWPVEFCRACAVIHGSLSPYGEDYGWAAPTPEQQARDDAWAAGGWPKAGTPPIEVTTNVRVIARGS